MIKKYPRALKNWKQVVDRDTQLMDSLIKRWIIVQQYPSSID